MTSKDELSRIVLIDDDPTMIRLMKTLIQGQFGFEMSIVCFEDPAKAIEHLLEGKADIILSDLEMPGVDGLDILKAVKSRNPFAQVLLLTGHSNHEAVLDALENGASDYLLKPVDKEQLFKLLRQCQERQLRWQRVLAETWRSRKKQSPSRTIAS